MIRITTSSFSPMIMVQPKKLMNSFLMSSGSMLIALIIMTAVVGWKIKPHRETQLLKLSFHCPFSIWCRIILH